jgi:hypothetical protein
MCVCRVYLGAGRREVGGSHLAEKSLAGGKTFFGGRKRCLADVLKWRTIGLLLVRVIWLLRNYARVRIEVRKICCFGSLLNTMQST